MSKEQRSVKRVPLQIKVDYKSEGNFLFENATNISEHGIFIETDQPLDPGTVLQLQFTLPETRKTLKVMGKVKWINPFRENAQENYNPGMGVQFESLGEVDREILLNAIKRIAVL
ncbi:MAG: TIGR02266 family protein [Bdellovibrionales bacterium]|nr:TIGR02266 family protein [Bdellovibrionales bacterium]